MLKIKNIMLEKLILLMLSKHVSMLSNFSELNEIKMLRSAD